MRRLLFLAIALSSPIAAAKAAPRAIVERVGTADATGVAAVDLVFLNDGAQPYSLPDHVPAIVIRDDGESAIILDRTGPPVEVLPTGFAAARYTAHIAGNSSTGETIRIAIAMDGAIPPPPTDTASVATSPRAPAPAPAAKPDQGNAFLGNLSSYAPIYAVYGPGTDSDARLQLSFKYQLFGDPGAVGGDHPWQNGIYLAYTQRMFWDLGTKSSPFRSVDFMHEIFYLLPARPIGESLSLGGQIGFRHESNGRGGSDSRSLNMIYVQPVASLSTGAYRITIGPRVWLYAGRLDDNPDIARYRGHFGLFAELGRDDGMRFTTSSRLSPKTGRGAIDAELSYPLDRIVASPLNLYVFGQAFTGYGENLLDYRRHQTRLRIGIGIVR